MSNEMVFIICFLVLFASSVYIFIRVKNIFWFNILMIFYSVLQGTIIGVLLADIFGAVIYVVMYYLFFTRILWVGKFLFKARQFPELEDRDLIDAFKQVIPSEKLNVEFFGFSGENSFNAMAKKKLSRTNTYEIFVGDKLRDALESKENVAVLAHEWSHATQKHYIKMYILFGILGVGVAFVSSLFNVFVISINPYLYFVNIGLFLIIFIIGLNAISWHYEFSADKNAARLTNKEDLKNAFSKFKEHEPMQNYGKFLNLLFYDHPLHHHRIDKLDEGE